MQIVVDADEKLRLETNSLGRQLLNLFLIPALNFLPTDARRLVKSSHQSVGEIIENVATHHALELLYQKGRKEHTKTLLDKLAHWIWFNTNNAKAVRNRIKIVKREIKKAVREQMKTKHRISFLSIAAGSARAVIESFAEMESELQGIEFDISFLDKDELALAYSQKLIRFHHISLEACRNLHFYFLQNTVREYLLAYPPGSFDIIEMVGLVDYFNNIKAETTFSLIRRILSPDGTFITANISPNSEEPFITKIIGWRMLYRSAEELGTLLQRAGFEEKQITLFYEPLRLHAVAVVKR